MKTTTKLSFVAAGFAFLATGAAFADDPQLQNRLDLQRNQVPSSRPPTTIGVYTARRLQTEATMAFPEHRTAIGRTENAGRERWREVTTPQGGTVPYFAPAE